MTISWSRSCKISLGGGRKGIDMVAGDVDSQPQRLFQHAGGDVQGQNGAENDAQKQVAGYGV